jgi:DnaJ-class molecular chaperone
MSNDDLPGEERRPGDEAPQGEPSSGENTCPVCEGSGKKDDAECPNCEGTGQVIEAIGGG